MYNEHFGFNEAPFNVTPDSRFFFVNSCYEEAFATVRYGIDTRKGFIVVTGEAGTGKTTVLKRLINSLESNVHTVCVFDPHLSFSELLRGMLGDLGLTPVAGERLAMMSQLYDYLIEQLEKGDIVALMVDEAQSVSIPMLEELRLLSNLETDTEKLIQIILVGQPGLVKKLECPELIQLKQRVALRCRILPLEENEVGSYIDSRLKTIRYPGRDLFDGECVEHIARYSKGIPRLINVICDNALLMACAAGRRWVSVDDIIEAATELQLVERAEVRVAAATPSGAPQQPVAPAESEPVWEATPKPNESFQPVWEKTPKPSDPAPQFEPSVFDRGAGASRTAHRSSVGGLFVLLLMAGTLFFAVQQKPSALPALRAYLQNWAGFRPAAENARSAQSLTPDSGSMAPVPAPMPVPEEPAPPTETLNDDVNAISERVERDRSEPAKKAEAPVKESSEVAANKRMVIKPPTPAPAVNEVSDQRLEIEIYKAIQDRAIHGVQVSWVDDGTVYLEGRVASRRQKLAAVRATLSVPGVKGVRDEIVID